MISFIEIACIGDLYMLARLLSICQHDRGQPTKSHLTYLQKLHDERYIFNIRTMLQAVPQPDLPYQE